MIVLKEMDSIEENETLNIKDKVFIAHKRVDNKYTINLERIK